MTHQWIQKIKTDKRTAFRDTVESGLTLRVSKKGTKTFSYLYVFRGEKVRYTIGKFPTVSLSDARKKIRELKVKISDGINPKKEDRSSAHFKEIAEQYKEKHLPTLRDSTQEEYERIIDNELIPALGKYKLGDITKNQIISVLDKKAYEDDAPTTANRIRARLSTIYTFAIERDLTEYNIVHSTPTYKEGKNERDRFYSEPEIQELWRFFEDQSQPKRTLFKILLVCGQRKTETMKMKWENISDGVWTIPADIAKNGKAHVVPLSKMAKELIDLMKPVSGESEYVFESPKKKGYPILTVKRSVKIIKTYSAVKDFRLHDLRRTFATYMGKLGVDRTTTGKLLNHKGLAGDSAVTAIYDRYNYMDEKSEAMRKWSGLLKRILN